MLYHRVSVNGKEEANFRTPHDSKYSFRHVGARGWLDFIPTLKRTYTFWVRQQHREMFLFLQWTPTLTLSFFLVVVVRNTNRDSSLWYILATGVSDWSDWSGDFYCCCCFIRRTTIRDSSQTILCDSILATDRRNNSLWREYWCRLERWNTTKGCNPNDVTGKR